MHQVSVQRAVKNDSIPSTIQLKKWVKTALNGKIKNAELTIRIVDQPEIIELNSTYRQKNKPTNVLSFPIRFDDVDVNNSFLGDIVICAEVVYLEAFTQNKPLNAHWAHMVVHGTLHLLGFDHEKDEDANIMESEEITILAKLGFANPYLTEGDK